MNSRQLIQFAIAGFGLTSFWTGCTADFDGSSGTRGASTGGSGGSNAGSTQGGTTGVDGSSSGTSGAAGSGGTSGSAGNAGSAGHSGGAGSGAGGQAGSGSDAGGSAGRGGTSGAGGSTGVDGGGAGDSSGGTLALTSPDHAEGAKFGTMFTCAAMNGMFGAGINPQLDWSGVRSGTMSFAITFIDTKLGSNNPMGQHWAAWDIAANVKQFPKGTTVLTGPLMGAKQTNKYLAPCPSGDDTYEFTLYALSMTNLNVTGAEGSGTSNSAGVAKVLAALQAITPVATATLHGSSGPMGK